MKKVIGWGRQEHDRGDEGKPGRVKSLPSTGKSSNSSSSSNAAVGFPVDSGALSEAPGEALAVETLAGAGEADILLFRLMYARGALFCE